MIAIICAIASGMTIVLSRSINGYLAKKIGPYQSTFFNYFTGLLTSSILLFFTLLPAFKNISFTKIDLIMLVGGIIGVFNVLIKHRRFQSYSNQANSNYFYLSIT